MKKKYNIFASILICFFVYVVLSWVIPTASVTEGTLSEGGTSPLGLFSIFYFPGLAVETFVQFGLLILVIGGFYGVMTKTGVYSKLVDGLADKWQGREKSFLIFLVAILIALNAFLGLPIALLLLVPFLMAVLLKLGFNKMTAVAATVGAILIGNLGSIYGYNVAAYVYNTLGMTPNSGLIVKLAMLIVTLFLFVVFVTGNKEADIKKGKSKKTGTEEVADNKFVISFAGDEVISKKNPLSLKIMFIITILISLLGMFNWSYALGITFFEDLHTKLVGVEIGGYPLFSNLLGFTKAFGAWDTYELIAVLTISSLIIGWIYNLKLVDVVDGFVAGAKRMLKPAIMATLANMVFVLILNEGDTNMLVWLTEKLVAITDKFNVFVVAIANAISGLFYNNFPYAFSNVNVVLQMHNFAEYNNVIGFISQGVHGLMMLIMPTSVILVTGLSLADVSFRDWFKYIWKYVLQVFVVILVVSIIIMMLV